MRNAALLALTGGGMRARFTARVLEDFQAIRRVATGEQGQAGPLRECFDLLAGTSAGALCVAGLVVGRTPKELGALLEAHGPRIFPARRWPLPRHLVTNKYRPEPLHAAVEQALDGKQLRLGDLDCTVAFPAFDETIGVPVVLTNARREYQDVLLHDAVLASAAAPSYFPAHRIPALSNRRFIDGGVFCNAPDLAAITVARRLWPQLALDQLHLVSVGTTNPPSQSRYADSHPGARGLLAWATRPPARLLTLVMRGQVDHSMDLLSRLDLGTFIRVDAELEHRNGRGFELDDASKETLATLVLEGAKALDVLPGDQKKSLQTILGRKRSKP